MNTLTEGSIWSVFVGGMLLLIGLLIGNDLIGSLGLFIACASTLLVMCLIIVRVAIGIMKRCN